MTYLSNQSKAAEEFYEILRRRRYVKQFARYLRAHLFLFNQTARDFAFSRFFIILFCNEQIELLYCTPLIKPLQREFFDSV